MRKCFGLSDAGVSVRMLFVFDVSRAPTWGSVQWKTLIFDTEKQGMKGAETF